jgi:FkbM family methyltransferase
MEAIMDHPEFAFLREVRGVVHVGANLGQERDIYQQLGLRVAWIEPIREVFDQLVSNIAHYKDQRAFCALITDQDDVDYEFNIANNAGESSSIFKFGKHSDVWPEIAYLSVRKLRSTMLTTLFKRESLTPEMYPALVMDVQGAELLVLKGAWQLLTRFKFIKAEAADFEVYVGCPQLHDIKEFLGPLGFEEIARVPFANRPGGGTCWNVIWKHNEHATAERGPTIPARTQIPTMVGTQPQTGTLNQARTMLDRTNYSQGCGQGSECAWTSGPFCPRCGASITPEAEAILRVHLINLDRTPERLAAFQRANAHLRSVERIAAVDGQRLDLNELARQGIMTAELLHPDYYTVGAIGIAMSQLAMWDRTIQLGRPITVAEDDAIFNLRFEQCAARVMESLPPDWEFILWGYNFDLFTVFQALPGISPCIVQFDQQQLRAHAQDFQTQLVRAQGFPLIWAFGIACYSISPNGAQAFKSRLLPLRPLLLDVPEAARTPPLSGKFRTVGIDNHMNALHRHIKSFVCFPPLVVTKNEESISTIRGNAQATVTA